MLLDEPIVIDEGVEHLTGKQREALADHFRWERTHQTGGHQPAAHDAGVEIVADHVGEPAARIAPSLGHETDPVAPVRSIFEKLDERLDHRFEQSTELAAASFRRYRVEEAIAPLVQNGHLPRDDRAYEVDPAAEVVLKGGRVALTGFGRDLLQRHPIEAVLGEEPLRDDDEALPSAVRRQ